MMPNDPVVGGNVLRRPAIESPNFVSGVSGWAINADGTAQFNQLTLIVQTTGAAVLIYSGSAGPGTLIGSWASAAGNDQFGNPFPAGLNANQGALTGILLTNPSIVGATILSAIINGPQITAAAITGGSVTETTITFDTNGGVLLAYSSSLTTVTQNVAGDYQITFPAGVTAANVSCWGADAGGGGGSSGQGGEGGGGGAFANNPITPVSPGTFNYTVGAGGTPGVTGSAGTDGGDSFFNFGQVLGAGGDAGANFIGGPGGTVADCVGTTAFAGGNGGGNGTQGTGGCGGGGRAGSAGAGGNGATSTGSGGGAGGTAGAGSGGHAGGNGGNAAANGSAPAGGAGSGSGVTNISKQYHLSHSHTYYGSDASSSAPPNGIRNSDTSMYQGGETASGGSFNGTMKSMGLWPFSTIQSDFSGATIDSVTLRLENLHSWYNSGLSVALGYTNNSPNLPSSYNGTQTGLGTFSMGEGQTKTFALPVSYGNALKGGTATTIVIGPGSGSFNLNYYGYFYGPGGDNNQNPMLTINGHIGAGSTVAGAGQDGQVTISYVSGQVLVASISPIAGTDQFGNPFPAGHGGLNIPLTTNTTTTQQFTTTGNVAITGLSAALAANATYEIELEIFAVPSGTIASTHNVKLNYTGSGTVTANSVSWQAASTSTATDQRTSFGVSGSAFPLLCTTSPPHQGFACWTRLVATISTTTAGTLTPQIALTTAGDDVTTQPGTRLVVTRTA